MKLLIFLVVVTMNLFSESVDIGDNRQIYKECAGTGSPVVILISGHSNSGEIWKKGDSSVFNQVEKFTKVCVYDRPGTRSFGQGEVVQGKSTPSVNTTTVKDAVEDLHKLISLDPSAKKVILVGHSFGGLIARLYASTYPDEVVGLVLVDSLTEFLYRDFSITIKGFVGEAMWDTLAKQYSLSINGRSNLEKVDVLASFTELQNGPIVAKIPVIVITSDKSLNFQNLMGRGLFPDIPIDIGALLFEAHLSGQKQLAELLNAKHITNTQAGHYIQLDQPKLVSDAIREVYDQSSEAAQ